MTTDTARLPASILVVVGSNHEYAPVSVREQLSFAGDVLQDGLQALTQRVGEGLIISTCNRTEIYVVSADEDTARDGIFEFLNGYHDVPHAVLEGASYVFSGDDAVNHLFRVATGLDSMVLGEPQILSQIRDALDAARAAGSVGPLLQRLATDALRVGKRARTETDISRNRMSIAHAAVDLAKSELNGYEGKSAVVLGAGTMAKLTAKLLRIRGISNLTIVNRSLARAHELAQATGAGVMPLSGLRHAISQADVVFGAATSESHMITPETIAGRDRLLLLVDLAVPRIIDAECEREPFVSVRDVDALEAALEATRRHYATEVDKVEVLVESAVSSFGAWKQSRSASEAIAAIRSQAMQIQDAEIERTLRRLSHLSDRDRNLVRALAVGVTNKLLHQPVQSLRQAESEEEVDLALKLFGLTTDSLS